MAHLAYRAVYAMARTKARLELVMTYGQTGSIRETARRWHTSRQVVRLAMGYALPSRGHVWHGGSLPQAPHLAARNTGRDRGASA